MTFSEAHEQLNAAMPVGAYSIDIASWRYRNTDDRDEIRNCYSVYLADGRQIFSADSLSGAVGKALAALAIDSNVLPEDIPTADQAVGA